MWCMDFLQKTYGKLLETEISKEAMEEIKHQVQVDLDNFFDQVSFGKLKDQHIQLHQHQGGCLP